MFKLSNLLLELPTEVLGAKEVPEIFKMPEELETPVIEPVTENPLFKLRVAFSSKIIELAEMLAEEFSVLPEFIFKLAKSRKLLVWLKLVATELEPISTEPVFVAPSTLPLMLPPKILRVPLPIRIAPLTVPELLMVKLEPEL